MFQNLLLLQEIIRIVNKGSYTVGQDAVNIKLTKQEMEEAKVLLLQP